MKVRRLVDIGWVTAGLGLGLVIPRPRLTVAPQVEDPGPPPPCTAGAEALRAVLTARSSRLQEELATLEARATAAGALPVPWPEGARPDEWERRARQIFAAPGWHVEAIDCREPPCMIRLGRDYDDLPLPLDATELLGSSPVVYPPASTGSVSVLFRSDAVNRREDVRAWRLLESAP